MDVVKNRSGHRWLSGVSQKKVSVQDLEVGMFVSALDRPWHLTPFPVQGFYIRSQEDIRALISHCRWVMVDVAEARDPRDASIRTPSVSGRRAGYHRGHQGVALQLPPIQIRNRVTHRTSYTLRRELKASRALLRNAEEAVRSVTARLRSEEIPDWRPVAEVAREMTASVIRNPDALLWLARVGEHDDYTYRHSLNIAVWALVFGRHLGLEESLLNHLATGCLLAHIGKTELPADLLASERHLDAGQLRQFRTYPELGAECLEAAGMSRGVVAVVRYHRERHNGSGFPAGVSGERIPLLAKVAGLVDCYESLIVPREGDTALSPAQAVSHLFEQRNTGFHEELVEAFIQAVGIYPIGTRVQLNNGQQGVVVSHEPKRRLLPRVMLVTDNQQRPLRTAKVLNLSVFNQGRSGESVLRIDACLPGAAEGFSPTLSEAAGTEARWRLRSLMGS